jgi:subtilisin family serine protease
MPRLVPSLAGALLIALLTAPVALGLGGEARPSGAAPRTPSEQFSPDRVIVEWAAGASHTDRLDAREGAEVDFATDLGNRTFQLVKVEPGQSTHEAIAELRADPAVVAAQRDGWSALNAVPNDPLFGQLWGLENTGVGIDGFSAAVPGYDIGAPQAWDRAVGTPSTVIADIDSGYRFDSPDLGPVAWENTADPPGGGDNDSNGYVDDTHGYDFVGPNADSPTSDNDPTDNNLISGGHGVHTAGTMGAAGNNGAGITGVARNVRIMPLRVCANSTNAGNEVRCPFSSQIAAINYAGEMGARVANMSLGGTTFNAAERDAIADNPDTLFVISAGNDAQDNDSIPHYPCAYNPLAEGKSAVDNVICVAATDQADGLAAFSDWGHTSVDLGAPGTETLSTFPVQSTDFSESFEVSNFASKWTSEGAGFGRAAAGDGPLTSFGMNDSPGGAPAASSSHAVVLSSGVTVPAGSGSCVLSGMRFRHADVGSSFFYQVLSDGSVAFENTASTNTAGSAMAPFNTVPILNLGGHSVKVRFGYTAGSSPDAESGIWLDGLALTCYAPLSTPLGYVFLQGTSMAAPHVTGAAGLLFSLKPSATVTEVRNALLSSTDADAALSGKTVTGGRLDVAAALDALVPAGTETVAPDTAITSAPPGSTPNPTAAFQFIRTDADASAFECKLDGGAFGPCTSPVNLSVGVGSHKFQARAKALSGLVDPTPASASWTVTESDSGGEGGGGGSGGGGGGSTATGGGSSPPSPTSGPPLCRVPKLAGKTLGQATAALNAAHCSRGAVTKPKAKKGHQLGPLVVKSTNPAAGSVSSSGKVSITLGPKPKPKKRHH